MLSFDSQLANGLIKSTDNKLEPGDMISNKFIKQTCSAYATILQIGSSMPGTRYHSTLLAH